jgi:hypothetical protein
MGHISFCHADDVNMLGKTVHAIKKKAALLATSKEICLEVSAEKMKYVCADVL